MKTPVRFILAGLGIGLVCMFTVTAGPGGGVANADEHEEKHGTEAAENAAGTDTAQAVDNCVVCHRENDNLPDHFMAADVHMQSGISCSGCHGGDPTSDDEDVAMSKAKGFRGVPSKEQIPDFCGRCHSDINFMRKYRPGIATDQETQYWTSVHGQKLRAHDKKVADCTSCHTAHSIFPASDTRSSVNALNVPSTCGRCHGDATYMAGYGIPTDQLEKFKKSVHGIALLQNQDTGAPACNDCHGNHGAMPPGVNSIAQICGQCHVNNMNYFTESRMGHAWVEQGFHACEECHGNHGVAKTSDTMIGTTDGAVCLDCHEQGDKGFETAGKIRASLDSLSTAYDAAVAKQKVVQRIGMDDVDIGFMLQEANQSLVQSRTLVHTFDAPKVAARTDEGMVKAQEASVMADHQVKEYHVRRRGFGMATLFTTILAIALFFRIRQMESRP
ncbi:MAG TPA: cytochrome c3 family protein [Candidatus Krumholzibacteria bacterium]|nr:cytochrome c3 family protein [Candidatus Krumholzibacteria bacterium]